MPIDSQEIGEGYLLDLESSTKQKSPTNILHGIVTQQVEDFTTAGSKPDHKVNEECDGDKDNVNDHVSRQGDLSLRNAQKSNKTLKKKIVADSQIPNKKVP